MGQAVAAVAFGVIPNKALWKKIRDHLEVVEDGCSDGWKPGLKREPNAHSSMTDRVAVVGFVIALAGSAEYKCRGARSEVPDLPIGDIKVAEAIIGKEYVAMGRRQWEAFAKWAKEHGVEMPNPTLIVTQVEIA